jgi:hypothetical protein
MFSMTKRIVSRVIELQMVDKHRAADWRIIAYLLRRAMVIMGKSVHILGHMSSWSVGTTASSTLRESMTSCPNCLPISESASPGESGRV